MPPERVAHLQEKIATVKEQAGKLRRVEKQLQEAPDQQVSLTDSDARSMVISGRGMGIVGYNVQAAVDTEHHMIVAHEVTNVGHDRAHLTAMSKLAGDAIGGEKLTVLADRGYLVREVAERPRADDQLDSLLAAAIARSAIGPLTRRRRCNTGQ